MPADLARFYNVAGVADVLNVREQPGVNSRLIQDTLSIYKLGG